MADSAIFRLGRSDLTPKATVRSEFSWTFALCVTEVYADRCKWLVGPPASRGATARS